MTAAGHGPDIADVIRRLHKIEAAQKRYIYERDEVARAITICLVNRAHLLLVGPPGIGKTTQVRLAAHHIAGGVFFYTQLTPFSTVEDLFGPVDIAAYKEGLRRRVGTGMLQEAHVAVVDEVYNGNEGALKSLLAPMSEGVYAEQGRFHPIPLRTLLGTANTFPSPEERREKGLAGFHDRWLFRFMVGDLESDSNFMKMLWEPDIDFQTYTADDDAVVTPEELDAVAAAASRVRLSVGISEELARIRKRMPSEGLYCSPRRWKLIANAMRTAALLAGRQDVARDDFSLLRHTLWDDPEDIPRVERLLEEYVTAVKDQAAIKFSHILEICGDFNEKRRSAPSLSDLSKLALEARSRVEIRIEEIKSLSRRSRSESDQAAVDQYLQKAYSYLRELDEAAGL